MLTFEARDKASSHRTVTIGSDNKEIHVVDLYVGAVLDLRERNGRDDSDFYAVCWDDEQGKPVNVDTWSTRFAKPYVVETVDATPEVVAKYKAWCKEQARLALKATRDAYAKQLRVLRAEMRDVCEKHGIPYANLIRVRQADKFGSQTRRLGKLVRLLKSKPKSDFKKSLQAQAVERLKVPGKWPCPLSPKQMSYCDDYGFRAGSRYSKWGHVACPLKDLRIERWRG